MRKKIVWLEEVDKSQVGLVGGKGANLGELINAGFPVPYGFIITAEGYFEFIRFNRLEKKIQELLANVDIENTKQLREASEKIRTLIRNGRFPEDLARKIIEHYHSLEAREEKFYKKAGLWAEIKNSLKRIVHSPLVAVRSSATAEDLPSASFAGQQETYLNVKGEHNLLIAVRNCFASLFTERAIYYREKQGFDHFRVGLAAVVQRMVQSERSGIAFTVDPVTSNKRVMVIEAIIGLGEYIVGGKVTPDHYEIDKNTLVIIKKQISKQRLALVRKGGRNVEIKLDRKLGESQKLSDERIIELAMIIRKIEQHYFFPQDIEWAFEKGRFYIVQSRPITTLKETQRTFKTAVVGKKPLLIGSPASPGIGIGPAKIILSPKEIGRVEKGDVLVAPQTNPDYVPAMKKAAAIVTEHGGRTSHAAIVSRELGIPAVVGAKGALEKVKEGMILTVIGNTGEVYKGAIKIEEETRAKHTLKKTKTRIYVNLAEPELADKVAELPVDGVGLLRAEFMIANIGVHPKLFIKEGRQKEYVEKLTKGVLKIAKAFYPRPVVYRATDFKTNEYRHLKGGKVFELKEENPMLGYRGALRYISDPEEFSLELEMIKEVHSRGFHNLYLMIPFVRKVWELIEIKKILTRTGILRLPNFKLWIMVETPGVALELEKFIEVGIDGVSIGTNDLTMLTLGVDRDNEKTAVLYDERSEAVLKLLERIIKVAKEKGITSSICGQAASDYPTVVERLIKVGITSLSVNPDVAEKTRELVYKIEKNI